MPLHKKVKRSSGLYYGCSSLFLTAVEVEDEKFFFRVVYAAFALRRKTLVNSLMTAFGSQLTKEQVTQAVTSCGLEANIRGERLGLSEFAALSAEIAALL